MSEPLMSEPLYPCDKCGKLRTKSEGGTIFTVCDDCWDKNCGAFIGIYCCEICAGITTNASGSTGGE